MFIAIADVLLCESEKLGSCQVAADGTLKEPTYGTVDVTLDSGPDDGSVEN